MKAVMVVLSLALAGWSGVWLAPHPALAASLCVGSGSGCYSTIQAALNAAHDGDVIHIGPGTFSGGVTITVSVQLIGAGSGSTLISGGGPVLTIGQVDASAEPAVSLRDLTITGGLNTSSPSPFRTYGGGIEVSPAAQGAAPATLTVTDSTITHNQAAPSQTSPSPSGVLCGLNVYCPFADAMGGGIDDHGTVALTDTTVSGNQAGSALNSDAEGGGITVWPDASLTLKNSAVTGNQAVSTAPNGRFANGGGIFMMGGVLTMNGGSVSKNAARLTGAIRTAPPSTASLGVGQGGLEVGCTSQCASATIRGASITGNALIASNTLGSVSAPGGGLHVDGSLVLVDSTVSDNTVSATSTFTGSPAGNAIAGAGGLVGGGTMDIRDSTFQGNRVTAISAAGLARVRGGALNLASPQATVRDSVIRGNSGSATSTTGRTLIQGGAVFNGGVLMLRDTAVTSNNGTATAPSGTAQGGGMWNGNAVGSPPQLSLIDSEVTGNALIGSPSITVQGENLYSDFPVTVVNSAMEQSQASAGQAIVRSATSPGSSTSFLVPFVSKVPGQGEVLFGSGPGCTGLVETATQDRGAGTTSHMVQVQGNDLPGTVGNNGIVPGVTYWYEVVTVTRSGTEIDTNGGKCYRVTVPSM